MAIQIIVTITHNTHMHVTVDVCIFLLLLPLPLLLLPSPTSTQSFGLAEALPSLPVPRPLLPLPLLLLPRPPPYMHLQLWADGSLGLSPRSKAPPPCRHLCGVLLGAEGKGDDGGGLRLEDGHRGAEGGLVVVVLAVVKDMRETHEGLVPTILGRLPVTRFGSCRATNGEDDIR